MSVLRFFFNLHAAHEYYSCANAVCLLVGIGVLLAPMFELPGRKAWVGVALLAVELIACIGCYVRDVYPEQRQSESGQPVAADIIDRTTSPQSVIVITGMDWSPQFAYQSERRAIMDLNFGLPGHTMDLSAIGKSIAMEGPASIAAVLACNKGKNTDRLPALLQMAGMTNPTVLHGDDCEIYERAAGPGPAAP